MMRLLILALVIAMGTAVVVPGAPIGLQPPDYGRLTSGGGWLSNETYQTTVAVGVPEAGSAFGNGYATYTGVYAPQWMYTLYLPLVRR
jgi:hypothetical protein